MLRKEMTKTEIEKEISGKGDYVKIDYLTRFLKEDIPFDTKKFVFLKLAEIYEKVNMFRDAAKCYESLAVISLTFKEKINYFMKEAELYVRAADFDEAEKAMKKAAGEANSIQKTEIYNNLKELYKVHAELFEKNQRRIHAIKAYEKLLSMKLSDAEKKEITEKLLNLYEKLGKVREYSLLKSKSNTM